MLEWGDTRPRPRPGRRAPAVARERPEGGPFLVVPHAALSHWTGTEGDYDRACEMTDLVGVLELPDEAEAFVLGDEPLPTAYLPEHRVRRALHGRPRNWRGRRQQGGISRC
ncbi:Imm21 family immunity protein [Streptomyces sp. NPDC088846]|uniref:Imm21 family immunity protein n=1 Tax=Streptomyces sp. NPDC088846 TaxID=3365908 RepID=UPI00381A83F7